LAKKKTVDLFGEDHIVPPQNEFDALLNSSKVHVRGLSTGDKFRGEVLAVNGLEAFIATGTPTDAVMPFVLGTDVEPPKAGDQIEVIVVRVREGEILVKPVGARGTHMETDSLEEAFNLEVAVEGVVIEAVKGGFRVKVSGQTAFCPISQIDWRCVNAEDYIGKKFDFLITKLERGRDLVVSRRRILEFERAGSESEFLKGAGIGDIFSGTVFRIEKYGAFVRLESGVDGLVPISELSWGRINHPQEVVNVDQVIQVKLLRAEMENNRLKVSFSLKQGGSVVDPWDAITTNFPVGSPAEGVVEHKEQFGLFVNIALGVTGLLPRSAWRDTTDGAQYENKRKGDKIKVKIEKIDTDAHKLSFSIPREDDDESWRDFSGPATSASKNQKFGTMADLLKGIKGK
jgi:small subunit ribosomal protein S1